MEVSVPVGIGIEVVTPGHWFMKLWSYVPGQSLMQRGGVESPVPFQEQVMPERHRERFTLKRSVHLQGVSGG